MVLVAAHQEQVGRRQHRDRDAAVGETFAPSPPSCRAAAATASPCGRPRRGRRACSCRSARARGGCPCARPTGRRRDACRCRRRIRAPARRCAGFARARLCRSAARRRSPWRRACNACTNSSSVPGKLIRPSCGNTQISMSIAHLYSPISAATPSKPRMPMPGSTSTCVRMRVVPCRMHCSSVAAARACTSSTVMSFLTGVTPNTGLSLARSCGAQRSMMRDLSRWMWLSIRPGQASRPLAS